MARTRNLSGVPRCVGFGFAAMLLALAGAPGGAARAAVTEEQAAQRIASDYGVEILRVRAGEIDDRAVWLVTVMKPGGNSNDAFQVTTLAVDQETGDLVPNFRPGSGAPPDAGEISTRIEQQPDVLRSRSWR